MANNDLGDIRRSAVASLYGPGAVIDFRAGGAPISAVAAGLEEWDSNFRPAGMLNEQAIREERLQKKLGVKGFRLPPVRDPANDGDTRALKAVRFPCWLQCPRCDRVGREDGWGEEPGSAGRYCQDCTQKNPGQSKVFVIPVRFVMSCEAGHLDEFPWHFWVAHEEGCANKSGFLRLVSEKAGLAGLILSCPRCNAQKSLDGVFSKETWQRFADCRGKRPWFASGDEKCMHKPRTVQRGASNLYFPLVESALSIPPWSDRLQEALGVHWDTIANTFPEDRAAYIRILGRGGGDLAPVLAELEMTPETLTAEIDRRLNEHQIIDTANLRLEEYRQFTVGVPVQGLDREFEIRPQSVPHGLSAWVSRLVKVVRLREVRAATGFTRINPPGDPNSTNVQRLSLNEKLDWLPAIEVRGEGVFLELDATALRAWESVPSVRVRADSIDSRWKEEWLARYGADAPDPKRISPRFLLIHTLAHALMRQLTLDCGYSSTALRERLYVDEGDKSMAGVLIFTATSDADGTLGGLQRQGDPARMGRTLVAALRAQEWCSSDPLCIEDMMAAEDGFSLAACHSCALAPETSCEEFNMFLDRAMLVGTPRQPELGFFLSLLSDLGR